MVAQVHGLLDGLEADGVLGQAGHRGRPRHRTGGQHHDVVVEVAFGAVDGADDRPPLRVVEPDDVPGHDLGPVPTPDRLRRKETTNVAGVDEPAAASGRNGW